MKFIFKLIAKLISFGVLFAVSMAIGLALYSTTLLPNLPTVEEVRKIPLNIPLRIYSKDNKLIAEYGDERRIPVKLDDTPPLLVDAILVSEDDQFYHHTGVDFLGLVRATISNLRSQSKAQGASTITMQVVRNFFLSQEKTYTRKLKEILLAFNMERALTKDEILELYLNKIFLGHRSYGFAAAAQTYYGQSLRNLSVPEIAMLAGLPKAPSRDNPISNPERATERRDYVLTRLHELGRIDDLSYHTALKAPITATRHVVDTDVKAPYIAEMARQIMISQFGETVYQKGLNVTVSINSAYQEKANAALRQGLLDYDMRHGFRGAIDHFSMDKIIDQPDSVQQSLFDTHLSRFASSRDIVPAIVTDIQEQQFSAVTRKQGKVTVDWEHIQWARQYIGPNALGPELTRVSNVLKVGDTVYLRQLAEDQWGLSQLPEISGALVCLDPHSGAILALSGGFDYYLSKFNRATQAKRQIGSNIKPFIYSAALDNGFTPSSKVSAAPIVVEDDLEGIWRPQNYSKKFFGPTRLRKALSLSLNLVSVRLLRAMGIDTTIEHLTNFGFDPSRLHKNLSLALGSTAATPLELASYYAVLANGGKRIIPYLIEKIEDNNGNELSLPLPVESSCLDLVGHCEPAPARQTDTETGEEAMQAISEQNTFLTTNIMKQVILSGTGRKALALNRTDLAGKTGTTNNFRDAWFSGFNPDVATSIYIGFDEPAHLGNRESGASAALPVWVDFMERVLADFPERPVNIPDNISSRFISKETGKVTDEDDPAGYTEYYLAGTEPDNTVTNKALVNTIEQNDSVESLF